MVRILPRKLALPIWAVVYYCLDLIREFIFFWLSSWFRLVTFSFDLQGFQVVHVHMVRLLFLDSFVRIWQLYFWMLLENNSLWRWNNILVLRKSLRWLFIIFLASCNFSCWPDEGRLYVTRLKCWLCPWLTSHLCCSIFHFLQALGLFIIIGRISLTLNCFEPNVIL